MHLCPLSPRPKTDDKTATHLSVIGADFPTPSLFLRTPSQWIKSRLRALTELPDVVFNMILKFMAGPGALAESCLTWHIVSLRDDCYFRISQEMQLIRRQHMITVSPISGLRKRVSFSQVTYVCGGGAGQGHRLNRCRESECGLCLFIFRGVRMTGWGGCWGKGSKPQHCIVFWRTTYIPREGNNRGTRGRERKGEK